MRQLSPWLSGLVGCSRRGPRILFSLTFSLLLVFPGRGGRGQETRPNLLRNGDFEQVAAAGPAGWTKSGSGTWSLEPGRFGERCLKLTAATGKQDRAEIWARSSDLPVTPGKHYLLVFWAKGEGLKQADGISSQVSWRAKRTREP